MCHPHMISDKKALPCAIRLSIPIPLLLSNYWQHKSRFLAKHITSHFPLVPSLHPSLHPSITCRKEGSTAPASGIPNSLSKSAVLQRPQNVPSVTGNKRPYTCQASWLEDKLCGVTERQGLRRWASIDRCERLGRDGELIRREM